MPGKIEPDDILFSSLRFFFPFLTVEEFYSSLMEYEACEKTIVEQMNVKLSVGSDPTNEKLMLFLQ